MKYWQVAPKVHLARRIELDAQQLQLLLSYSESSRAKTKYRPEWFFHASPILCCCKLFFWHHRAAQQLRRQSRKLWSGFCGFTFLCTQHHRTVDCVRGCLTCTVGLSLCCILNTYSVDCSMPREQIFFFLPSLSSCCSRLSRRLSCSNNSAI